jgi:hypothetical protein
VGEGEEVEVGGFFPLFFSVSFYSLGLCLAVCCVELLER